MKTSTIEPQAYDLLVLGISEAGKYLAWTMAKKGATTAVVERKYANLRATPGTFGFRGNPLLP